MGRTISSSTKTWDEELKALKRFRHALRKSDQVVFDDLMSLAHLHIAEASYAANLFPMDIFLFSMIIELAKNNKKLEMQLQKIGLFPETHLTDMQKITSLSELIGVNDSSLEDEGSSDDKLVYIDPEESA